MNLPNKLTTIRIFLIIPFLTFGILFLSTSGTYSFANLNLKTIYFIVSLVIFTVAMFTDWLDGRIARKRNIVTSYGKLFDPLADKIMTSSTLIILAFAQLVPIWLVVLMIIRDILVDGCRNLLAQNNAKIEASFAGKAKTMLQSIGIIFIFIFVPAMEITPGTLQHLTLNIALVNIPLYFALILSIYSGLNYVKKASAYINVK